MYAGAKILDVDHQEGRLFIWAFCDESRPKTDFRFRIHGTGHDLPNVHEYEYWYFKTVHVREHGLVWHIFDLNKERIM